MSPSSQRAWIEIVLQRVLLVAHGGSPSSQRAWIEIKQDYPDKEVLEVALFTEGVD